MKSSDPELAYRHERDEQRLRDAVLAIKQAQHIGAKKLIAEFGEKYPLALKKPGLEVPTLNKWLIKNGNLRLSLLTDLYAWILSHPHYQQFLMKEGEAVSSRPSVSLQGVELLAHALKEVCPGPAADALTVTAPKLAGRYLLFRAGWIGDGEDTFRSSLVIVTSHEGYTEITEVQDYPRERPPYYQQDAGALFAYGPYVYGFLRETGGTFCVKLMVIEAMFEQDSRANRIDRFQGYLLAASQRGVFRRIAFACCRITQPAPALGPVRATDIPDYEAARFLLGDDPAKIVTGLSGRRNRD